MSLIRRPLLRASAGQRRFFLGLVHRGNSACYRVSLLLILLFACFAASVCAQETLIPAGSSWRWRKGTNEVSNPSNLWRGAGFDDASWSLGNAPFHYGESLTGGTLLSDMRSNYSCIFLRTRFVVANVSEIASVQFVANYDDGFVAWINGTEVARLWVTNGAPAYTNTASISHEAGTAETITITNLPANYLVSGTNVLAVQAFNQNRNTSTDFRFETALEFTSTNLTAPVITSVNPAPESVLGALAQITVFFSKPVSGVDAADLTINDQPATAVIGNPGTNRYAFTFTQPAPGVLDVRWGDSPGITDLQGSAFDHASATWSYSLVDNVAPQASERTPAPGAQVSHLTQVEVTFNEPVFGVDAADLRINGQPAVSISGTETGPYVFQFAQPSAGTVNFSWAAGHGITDLAANSFPGGNWSVNLNPALVPGDIVINEFVAGNLSGLLDEDGQRSDWIEIYNRGSTAVNLLGWSLTDNPNVPGLWTFPARTLNPGQYLLVFASGKDRRAPAGANKFHTNFRLDLFGEYLALFNPESPRVAVSEFTRYPEQRNNYSYGQQGSKVWRYFQTPTPEAANGSSSIVGIAPEPHFSVGRGLFDAPFNLLLTTTLPGATIRYTIDGSEPTEVNGADYSSPLQIADTAFVRATVFAPDYLPSRTRTHSYIHLDSVLNQSNFPPGFPSTWGTYASFPGDIVPADYEVDSDPLRTNPNDSGSPVDPDKLQRFRDGMRELPVVSIVMDVDDIFNPPGLYHTPNITDKNFPDQPCSVEMLLPDGTTAFAVNGGLRAHGNASREPRKNPKHGFKLNFRGEFGEARLDYPLFPDSPARAFDDLILRPDFNSSWRHWSDSAGNGAGAFQRTRATRLHDAWIKHTQRDMGHVASHNRFFHLFINGLYWGTYDFTEQPTGHFGANYFGGTDEEYDVYDQGALSAGTATAYQTMLGIGGLNNNANYELMKQYLDVKQFSDYMLLHYFAGHQDWGNNKNWYAVRKRAAGPAGTFKYFPWDGECVLLEENVNRVSSADVPSGLFTKLDDNAQFRLDFADRVHKHMVAPDGALTRAANTARWEHWQAIMDKPIVAESVRWGDYRRDVHQYQDGVFQLYTREDHWLPENDRKVNSYLVNRGNTVLNQLRTAGLYPAVGAPEFRRDSVAGPIVGGGAVGAGNVIALRNPGAGTVYYTTNGSDPRVYYSGTVAADALTYSAPLTLNASVTIKARVLNGAIWSALNEATFTVGELGLPLRITEIMYNPNGGEPYEFIEIQNLGALPLDIGGFSFQGIDFVVPVGTIIQSGALLLLANNASPPQFAQRYPSAIVFGYYANNLANGGERVAILDNQQRTVTAVHYDDQGGWLTSPDGGGYSLEIMDPRRDPNAPDNWRASSIVNGTPGLPPLAPVMGNVVLNEIMADNAGSVTNGGAFPDWVELHNRGGSATNLSNWSLTDDSNSRKFVFPANATIPAGGFLVVWCDTATNSPGLHTGFALGRNGETVSLFDPGSNRVDAITCGLQLTDYTVGRVADEWRLTSPTPNAANAAATVAASSQIAINEWLASPDVGGQDWLELFNRSSTAPVALRGLHFGTSNAVFRYAPLSFVAPRGYAQLFAEELPGADQLGFKLPLEGGHIALYNESGVELERVIYGRQTTAVSEGRLPDGNATITAFSGSVSPGASNYVLAYNGPVLNEVLARNQRAVLSPWGSYADFVELFNGGGGSANVGGMALGRSLSPSDRWTIPAGVSIAAGGYLRIWCDGSRAPSISNTGPGLNAGFNLSGESGDVILFNSVGQPVDSVGYGFQVDNLSIGRSGAQWRLLGSPTPGTANAAPAALGSATDLRINEWMASPLAGDDWFELYNSGTLPVELGGLFVTDDPSAYGVTKSPVPPLSFIGAGRWVTFIADDNQAAGRDHAAFVLDSLGETLRLYDANLNLIDVVDFGVQTSGASEGRVPDGGTSFATFTATASFSTANYLPLASVVVNEVLTHTDAPLEDAVELHNPTGSPVDIGGWYLSDSQTDLKRFRIPDGTIIPAGGFKAFYQNQFGPADGEADVPPLFSFNSAQGDAVWLSQTDAGGNLTGSRAGFAFDAAANGVSFGRYETSVGVDFVAMSRHTFGVSDPTSLAQFRTGTGDTNSAPRVGPIVFSEIMYHPPDWETNTPAVEEFIELLNLASAPVQLYDPTHSTNVWRLANAVSFSFPSNTTIAANGLLLVVPFDPVADTASLAAFRARYGSNAPVVGPYSGSLDNAGESLELWRPDQPQSPPHPDAGFVPYFLVERVAYGDQLPWPIEADGLGLSLQRIVATDYGNDPVNWKAESPTAGRANANINSPIGTVSLIGGDKVRLSYTVQSGVTYQLQYKTSLTDAVWLPLGLPVEATGSVMTVEDVIAGQARRFYRLVGLP
jgi:hypothetical protein